MKSNKDVSKNEEEKKDRNRTSYSELPDDDESAPVKTNRRESKTTRDLKDTWVFRRNKTSKEKDPERFSGDGINFKAKIIGIESVFEARGNRMCQDALQNLKAAVKVSGEHKQRILLNISLVGIRIKDEKSGEVLHHHPVHKISFISQDVNDSRSFGYVFGCPQTGHQFFGIKTEKTAAQVVCALRDLFHTVLELKRKEIEKAIEQQNEDGVENDSQKQMNGRKEASPDSSVAVEDRNGTAAEPLYSEPTGVNGVDESSRYENTSRAESSNDFGCTVDDLLDLKFEMDTIQQGITQMDNSMASAVPHGFGISFSEDDNSVSSLSSFPATPRKLNRVSSLYHETLSVSSRSSSTSDYTASAHDGFPENFAVFRSGTFSPVPPPPPVNAASEISLPPPPIPPPKPPVEDRYAVFYEIDSMPSVFDNPSIVQTALDKSVISEITEDDVSVNQSSDSAADQSVDDSRSVPATFTELDPLGDRPFIDRQDFFSQIKSPPRKVLKDLIETHCDIDNSFSDQNAPHDSVLQRSDSAISQERLTNPFASADQFPPKLPPKRSGAITSPSSNSTRHKSDESAAFNKNPFNPFAVDDNVDIPPPDCAPPPPPPPRYPTRESEMPPTMSPPPPPRPPGRPVAAPTPPRPRRKVSLGSVSDTWFSFNQDDLSSGSAKNSFINSSWTNPPLSPPLPLPLRKLPSGNQYESSVHKSLSASNSPAPSKRFSNHSSSPETSLASTSSRAPHRILAKHMSIAQETWPENSPSDTRCEVFQTSFGDSFAGKDTSVNECAEVNHILSLSPPLPPKSSKIARPRPSPSRKMLSAPSDGSRSSSNCSSVSSRNGTSSSSSPRYSSLEESKCDEVYHAGHTGASCFSANSGDVSTEGRSSTASAEEKHSPLSPDSIFRRKSDPFSDDFFLSLPKKSSAAAINKQNTQMAGTNDFQADFRNGQVSQSTVATDAT